LIGSETSAALPLRENTGFAGGSAIAGRSDAKERWSSTTRRRSAAVRPPLRS
jgi:hypothetical protein